MRILAIAGTRPEAVKLAPVLAALAREPCVSMLRDDGEAFAWLPGGEGWVTVTEGRAAAIWGAERR